MRKDLKTIEKHKEWLDEGMSSVPLDSIEYQKMLDNYSKLVDTEEKIRKGKKDRSPGDVIYKVLTLGVSILGAVFVPLKLGQMAYKNEQDMNLKNSTVWNLIPKGKLPDIFNK